MPALSELSVIPVTETIEVVARDNTNNRKGVVPFPGGGGSVPVGTVLMYAGTAVPAGYLLCNGQAVSRTGDYADLFVAIGVQFGAGNGTDTFNVPDFRGRSPVGTGEGTGLTPRNTGDTFGAEEHTLIIAEMPTHRHRMSGLSPGGGGVHPQSGTSSWGGYTDYQGGNVSHNNIQPSLAVPYIIKY